MVLNTQYIQILNNISGNLYYMHIESMYLVPTYLGQIKQRPMRTYTTRIYREHVPSTKYLLTWDKLNNDL